MAGGGDLYQTQKKFQSFSADQLLDYSFTSLPPQKSFGSRAMLSFGFDNEEIGNEYFDEHFYQPEKKRRLSVDQVQFLERSFDAENKLEPERKIHLAKELGVEPRQIAVWFQNRRARWKTQQLETDYETLHTKYKNLQTDYNALLEQNEKLKAEVRHLKHDMPKEAIDMSTEKVWTDKIQSTMVEACEWYGLLGFDESDSSQNGDDDFSAELLQQDCNFQKIEDSCCHPSAAAGSFGYGFPIEDQAAAFGFWSC